MDVSLDKDEVVDSLWGEYKKTMEYRNGMIAAIPSHHPIVEKREAMGLKEIYKKFIQSLEQQQNIKDNVGLMSVSDWLNEWKEMHRTLFAYVLKDCGNWRKKDVRFGDPGDEDFFKIPPYQQVVSQISYVVSELKNALGGNIQEELQRYRVLARLHFEFIRIHPFEDGNGRIARAVVDKVAMSFGLPPAMGGFPRHTPERRAAYHKAIRSCVGDSDCSSLAQWIKNYVDNRISKIA